MNISAYLKDAFHVVGISTLFSAVTMMCWIFYDISTQGYFILGENHMMTLSFEVCLVGFSVIYVSYLLIAYVKKKTGTQDSLSANSKFPKREMKKK